MYNPQYTLNNQVFFGQKIAQRSWNPGIIGGFYIEGKNRIRPHITTAENHEVKLPKGVEKPVVIFQYWDG